MQLADAISLFAAPLLAGSTDGTPPSFISPAFDEGQSNLSINDNSFSLIDSDNYIDTQTFDVGEKIILEFIVFEQGGADSLIHFEFLTNLTEKIRDYSTSDTYLVYDKDEDVLVNDPHKYFSNTAFSITDGVDDLVYITVELTFAKPMESSDVIIRMWDQKRQSFDTTIHDIFVISGNELISNTETELPPVIEDPVIEDPVIEDPVIEDLDESVIIPEWLKKNAGWWSQDQLDDTTFISAVQYLIQNQVIDIPSLNVSADPDVIIDEYAIVEEAKPVPEWIKNSAGWWSKDMITDDEFLDSVKWLVENGVIPGF